MGRYPQNPFETKLVMMGAELLPELDRTQRTILEGEKVDWGPEGTEREVVGEKDMGNYTIRTERMTSPGSEPFEIKSAYTKNFYIGDPETAKMLDKRGIKPELSDPKHNVCSIGFCEKDQKWYGWSHRAIFGFGIGDELTDKDCGGPKKPAKTLEDAKELAIAFADSVS